MMRSRLVTQLLTRRSLSTGGALPSVQLRHSTPGDLFSIPTSGKQLVVGVPAAFSPGCSNSHIPGYLSRIQDLKKAGIQGIHIISVNDVFVMNAWSNSFSHKTTDEVLETDGDESGYVKFLADHDATWTKAAEVGFDASKILGNYRSKRYAALLVDGKIEKLFIEPDNTSVTISSAESVMKELSK